MSGFSHRMTNDQVLSFDVIDKTICSSDDRVLKVLQKAEDGKGISLKETSILLNAHDDLNETIFNAAKRMNEKLYSKTITFYGVSYISDLCINSCTYCGDNVQSDRSQKCTLSLEDFERDLKALLNLHDFKQVCFLSGEHPSTAPDKLVEFLKIAAELYKETIIINVAPMSVEDFRMIKTAIPNRLHFRVFQETYDKKVYNRHHLVGPKADYFWRVESQGRALEAGFDEVGFGVLFGLNNKSFSGRYEVLAMKVHADFLKKTFNQYPASISFPRLRVSKGVSFNSPIQIDDDEFEKLIAVTRLAIPQTQLIITCRETKEFRSRVRPLINIEDYAAKPGPGGNYRTDVDFQMELEDTRSGEEVKAEILHQGYSVL
jgi:2-iminoacetate synthase